MFVLLILSCIIGYIISVTYIGEGVMLCGITIVNSKFYMTAIQIKSKIIYSHIQTSS